MPALTNGSADRARRPGSIVDPWSPLPVQRPPNKLHRALQFPLVPFIEASNAFLSFPFTIFEMEVSTSSFGLSDALPSQRWRMYFLLRNSAPNHVSIVSSVHEPHQAGTSAFSFTFALSFCVFTLISLLAHHPCQF
jgi:hypothetical protein